MKATYAQHFSEHVVYAVGTTSAGVVTDARGGKLRTNTQEGIMPSSIGTGEGFEKRNSKLSVSLADYPRVRGCRRP